MSELKLLESILDISIAKNGDKPLTLSHLRNLVRVARRMNETEEDKMEKYHAKLAAECGDPNL